jgi:hypothetical protein
MPPTTVAYHDLRDNMIVLIEALTPRLVGSVAFREVPEKRDIVKFASTAGSAAFRKFEVRRHPDKSAEEPPYLDPSAYERNEYVRIAMAYPVLPGLYGFAADDDDIDQVMRSDAGQIRDEIFSPSNYLAGQSLAQVTIEAPDRQSETVFYQYLTVLLIYTEAQTL